MNKSVSWSRIVVRISPFFSSHSQYSAHTLSSIVFNVNNTTINPIAFDAATIENVVTIAVSIAFSTTATWRTKNTSNCTTIGRSIGISVFDNHVLMVSKRR